MKKGALRVLICELCEAQGYICGCLYCAQNYKGLVMPTVIKEDPKYAPPADWVLPTPMPTAEEMIEQRTKRVKSQSSTEP